MNGVVFQSYYDFFNQCFLIIIKIQKKRSGLLSCSRLKHTKIVRKYLGDNEDRYHYFYLFFQMGKGA